MTEVMTGLVQYALQPLAVELRAVLDGRQGRGSPSPAPAPSPSRPEGLHRASPSLGPEPPRRPKR